ncbi:MAG: hypothetical protein H6R14_1315 [Proteobacteria bacterium]|nr:hypothetical protein [Pseudomonadota bacterium]
MKFHGFLMVLLATLMAGVVSDASAHGVRGRVGVYIGGPVWGPWYPAPYYYPPPQVIVVPPPQPQVYIEQSQESAPESGQQYWYFCKSAQGYYPYVKECPGGWQKVLPQPEK